MSKYLKMATEELYAAHQETMSPADSRLARVLDDLIHHLESAPEVQPHRHRLWVEPALGKHLTEGPWLEVEPREETPRLAPDIALTEDALNGNSISFKSWHLVREGPSGELETTITVTIPASSSQADRGEVLKPLLAEGWTLKTLTTWESPSLSGVTQSTIPELEAAGRSAGGAEVGQ
jgi:hypothetical protein